MKQYLHYTRGQIFGAILIGLLFVLAAHVSNTYADSLRSYMGNGLYGMFLYGAVACIATVLAPLSATPLIPIASALWGPFTAALLSIGGWLVGAIIAFVLARRYGYHFAGKLHSVRAAQLYVKKIPEGNIFLTVVMLRVLMPVDILSYALGLITTMPLKQYTIATLIGITPFAFIFAYAASVPIQFQILLLMLTGLVLVAGHKLIRKKFLSNAATTKKDA